MYKNTKNSITQTLQTTPILLLQTDSIMILFSFHNWINNPLIDLENVHHCLQFDPLGYIIQHVLINTDKYSAVAGGDM